ncbi:MAG: macro domain-containing protein [Syntrophomonadaceae bacterium]|jgi:O-acetyl-ADP-ribose deacetylase (regulator of RNase III)
MEVTVVNGNILDQKVEVIVNAWNRNLFPWWLLLPQGVSGAIKKKAGVRPFNELIKYGILPLGEAVVTSAGKLNYKAIIHVAGINLLWRASEKSIRLSVRNALGIAEKNDYKSIAFPVIGAGSGGFNINKSIEIMKNEINKYNYDFTVIIVVKR